MPLKQDVPIGHVFSLFTLLGRTLFIACGRNHPQSSVSKSGNYHKDTGIYAGAKDRDAADFRNR